MQEFRCWDTSEISHYAQVKFRFFGNFMHFQSKTAAEIFPQLLTIAPPKSRYQRNFFALHDEAIRFGLLLQRNISSCQKNVVAEFPNCR